MNSFQLFKKRKNCENSTKILRSIWYPFRKFEFHNGTFCSQIDRCLRSSTEYLQNVHNSPPNWIPLKTWSTIFIWKKYIAVFYFTQCHVTFSRKNTLFQWRKVQYFYLFIFYFFEEKKKTSRNCIPCNLSSSEYEVYAWWNDIAKCFKICYIFGIRNPSWF